MRHGDEVFDEPADSDFRSFASACWRVLCAPVHAVLAIAEPLVSIVLGLLSLLGVCASLVFQLLHPSFPFWTMIGVSLSFLVGLMLYHALLRLAAPR